MGVIILQARDPTMGREPFWLHPEWLSLIF
jgi:hypothetical protein